MSQKVLQVDPAVLIGPGKEFEIASHKLCTDATPDRTFNGFVRGETTLPAYFRRWCSEHAQNTFLVYQEERITYAQFEAKAAALAHALKQPPYNVKPGDRVGICMRNYPEWPLVFVAATSMGAISVAMNSLWKTKELDYGIKDSGLRVLCCDEDRFRYAVSTLEETNTHSIVVRSKNLPNHRLVESMEVVLQRGRSMGPMPWYTNAKRDDPTNIMYTSGTTGNPKGVVHTHRGICDQMMMARLGAALFDKPSETKQQLCQICPVPLFHVTGSHHLLLSAFPQGRKVCLMYKWDPAEALRLIEVERPTFWTGVPTMLQDLIEHPDFKTRDTSSLKAMSAGGAPTAPSLVPKFAKSFNGAVGNGYGLTETNGGVCTASGAEYLEHPGTCGKPFPICEAKVVDLVTEEEFEYGRENRGELLLRSSLNMLHYWNKPEATKKVFTKDGWFRTGDIAEIDDEGFIYIVDRKKDIVIRGGENISCSEVEDAFYKNSNVMECTAVGVPDERLGEDIAIMAFLKTGARATASELQESVKGELAGYKIPKLAHIYFTPQPLPRGATGKILKAQVRKDISLVQKHPSKM